MKYVFDSNSLINLFRYYYPERFPSLWNKFNALVSEEKLVSVREVYNEVSSYNDSLAEGVKDKEKYTIYGTNR